MVDTIWGFDEENRHCIRVRLADHAGAKLPTHGVVHAQFEQVGWRAQLLQLGCPSEARNSSRGSITQLGASTELPLLEGGCKTTVNRSNTRPSLRVVVRPAASLPSPFKKGRRSRAACRVCDDDTPAVQARHGQFPLFHSEGLA